MLIFPAPEARRHGREGRRERKRERTGARTENMIFNNHILCCFHLGQDWLHLQTDGNGIYSRKSSLFVFRSLIFFFFLLFFALPSWFVYVLVTDSILIIAAALTALRLPWIRKIPPWLILLYSLLIIYLDKFRREQSKDTRWMITDLYIVFGLFILTK